MALTMERYDYGVRSHLAATTFPHRVFASEEEVFPGAAAAWSPFLKRGFIIRYQAAGLGWKAAGLMPKQCRRDRRVLCTMATG